MKDNTMLDFTTGMSYEKEYMILMRHIMSAEQVYVEKKLSKKSAQVLVIKKVNQGLQKNAKNLISGILKFTVVYSKDKHSVLQKHIKEDFLHHSEEVFVALKQRRLEWFLHEEHDTSNDGNAPGGGYRCLGFVDLD